MRKVYKGKKLLAALLVLAVLLCSFPVIYAEEMPAEISAEQVAEALPETAETALPEAEPALADDEPASEAAHEEVPEEEPAVEPEAVEAPEEEPAVEPETAEIPEEEPAAEPEVAEIPEEEPAAEPEVAEIPEEEPAAEPEDVWEEAQEAETAGEACCSEDLVEFDDQDAGSVAEELVEEFDNPETYDRAEFSGNVEIEMKNSEIYYDQDVTLVARVSGTELNHRIVWEANDGDGRGWFTVGSGPEYTFTVTRDVVDREYRVSLLAVD